MLKKVFWKRPEGRSKAKATSDKDLARQLSARISDELPEAGRNRLRFYVREGAVTIYGTVLALEDRMFVRQLVRNMPGVAAVYDHLTVEPTTYSV